jgi:hypothetical protein
MEERKEMRTRMRQVWGRQVRVWIHVPKPIPVFLGHVLF